MQKVRNKAARIVTKTSRREHVTPVLRSLHWLPVEYQPNFKMLTLTFKALAGTAPPFICDDVELHQTTHSLRSSSQTQFKFQTHTRCNMGIGASKLLRPPYGTNSLRLSKIHKLSSLSIKETYFSGKLILVKVHDLKTLVNCFTDITN